MWIYQVGIVLTLLAFLGLVARNLRDYRKPAAQMPQSHPFVSLCLPARNESANIEA